MAKYLLITRELLAGLFSDLEQSPALTDLKSEAGARRNMLRLILAGDHCEHARPIPTTTEELAKQAQDTKDRLRVAERLIRRCQPLIVEGGGKYVVAGSATDAVERFLKGVQPEVSV